jgi:hypothetical protein
MVCAPVLRISTRAARPTLSGHSRRRVSGISISTRYHRCEAGFPGRPWMRPVGGSRISPAITASGVSKSTSTSPPEGAPHSSPTLQGWAKREATSSGPMRRWGHPGRLGCLLPWCTGMGTHPRCRYSRAHSAPSRRKMAWFCIWRSGRLVNLIESGFF